jgi:hypothetical protein
MTQVLFAEGLAGGGTQGLGVADLPGGGLAAELGAEVLGAVRISALKVFTVAVRVLAACSRVASRIRRASRVSPVRGRRGRRRPGPGVRRARQDLLRLGL